MISTIQTRYAHAASSASIFISSLRVVDKLAITPWYVLLVLFIWLLSGLLSFILSWLIFLLIRLFTNFEISTANPIQWGSTGILWFISGLHDVLRSRLYFLFEVFNVIFQVVQLARHVLHIHFLWLGLINRWLIFDLKYNSLGASIHMIFLASASNYQILLPQFLLIPQLLLYLKPINLIGHLLILNVHLLRRGFERCLLLVSSSNKHGWIS